MTTGHLTAARPRPISRYPMRIRWRRYSGSSATAGGPGGSGVLVESPGSGDGVRVDGGAGREALCERVGGRHAVRVLTGGGGHIGLQSSPARPKTVITSTSV